MGQNGRPELTAIARLLFVLFFLGSAISYHGAQRVPAALSDAAQEPWNVWFQADLVRVRDNLVDPQSNHYRTNVHPLFSILCNPPVQLLRSLGLSPSTAVRLLTAMIAGSWLALLGLLLLRLGVSWQESAVFSLLALVSSSFVFWSTVPETYLLGSVTILAVLLLLTREGERTSARYWTILSAASLSVTTTNWMAGIVATALSHRWRRSLQITADALVIVVVLWAVQKIFYPSAGFFLPAAHEIDFVAVEAAGGFTPRSVAFFSHSMVMPAIQLIENSATAKWPSLSVQFSTIGSSGPLGLAATGIWLALLTWGVATSFKMQRTRRLHRAVVLIVVGQLLLHLVYGEETFLYSLHWLPLLVLVAATGLLSRRRRLVVVAAAILVVCLAVNNFSRFSFATSVAARPRPAETAVWDASQLDPRGDIHMPIGIPNQLDTLKTFVEGEGSFSPASALTGSIPGCGMTSRRPCSRRPAAESGSSAVSCTTAIRCHGCAGRSVVSTFCSRFARPWWNLRMDRSRSSPSGSP